MGSEVSFRSQKNRSDLYQLFWGCCLCVQTIASGWLLTRVAPRETSFPSPRWQPAEMPTGAPEVNETPLGACLAPGLRAPGSCGGADGCVPEMTSKGWFVNIIQSCDEP